jgi:hypothetical protein
MIELSELAATALIESQEAIGVGEEKSFRLGLENDQPTLKIDSIRDNDDLIMHNGIKVLIVDKDLETKIGDAFIGIEDSQDDPHLFIRRHVPINEQET